MPTGDEGFGIKPGHYDPGVGLCKRLNHTSQDSSDKVLELSSTCLAPNLLSKAPGPCAAAAHSRNARVDSFGPSDTGHI